MESSICPPYYAAAMQSIEKVAEERLRSANNRLPRADLQDGCLSRQRLYIERLAAVELETASKLSQVCMLIRIDDLSKDDDQATAPRATIQHPATMTTVHTLVQAL